MSVRNEGAPFTDRWSPVTVLRGLLLCLHRDIMKAMAAADVRERLAAIAMEPVGNSPEAFAAQVKADVARWARVIRDAGIKVD